MKQEKADAILQFIRQYIHEHEVSPSVREICEGTNIHSTSMVHKYLQQLQEDGRIRRSSGKGRTIVIMEQRGIPVISRVAAGTACTDPCNTDAYVSSVFPSNSNEEEIRYFAVYAPEDNAEAAIRKHDMLIADRKGKGDSVLVLDEDGQIMPGIRAEVEGRQKAGEIAEILGTVIHIIRNLENHHAEK